MRRIPKYNDPIKHDKNNLLAAQIRLKELKNIPATKTYAKLMGWDIDKIEVCGVYVSAMDMTYKTLICDARHKKNCQFCTLNELKGQMK